MADTSANKEEFEREISSINLTNPPKNVYAENANLFKEHFVEQYKIYAIRYQEEMKLNLQRERFFITLNSIIISGIIIAKGNVEINNYHLLIVSSFCMILSSFWYVTMKRADILKKRILSVLRRMELELPATPYYSENYDSSVTKGKPIKLGKLRTQVALLFSLGYFVLFLYFLSQIIDSI